MPRRASKSTSSRSKAQTACASTSNSNEAASSRKSSEILVKCNCINSRSENGSSCNPESGSLNSSSMQASASVSEGPPPAKRKCCLKQRFGSVFNSELSSDVSFAVGQGNKKDVIPAHKLVLTLGSDVFSAMFSKNWSADSTKIEVPDIEPSIFLTLLRFLYMDETELALDTVSAVLYAARKYAVLPLEDYCVDFLLKNLSPINAFEILKEATLLDIQKLMKSCLEVIDEDSEAAFASEAFLDIDSDTLCLVIRRNTLTISEIKIFEAVLRWSKAECEKRNLLVSQKNQHLVLKKALPLIRFPLMSAEEFSTKVAPLGLLSKDELLSVTLYLITKPRPIINFNETSRLSNRELIINRFKKSSGSHTCRGGKCNRINFTCDHDLELLGYGLYGSTSGAANYEVILALEDKGVTLCGKSSTFLYDGTTMTFRALFENPIRLTPFITYTAYVEVKGPDCFMGAEGLEEVKVDLLHGRKVTVTFSTDGNYLTTVTRGFIPQLIFKV